MKNMKLLRLIFAISCLMFLPSIVQALDLLDKPAIESKLAEKSIVIGLVQNEGSILAVGERGHILNWQAPNQWQQEKVPVSVTLTSVAMLSDGTKVAVGHDSVIITCAADTNEWQKIFDGYDLLNLKIALFEKQIAAKKAQIGSTEDEDILEELEYQLEDLDFTLEDALAEKANGPNKPLLSIAVTSNDQLVAVGAYGTLLLSQDKGKSWQLIDEKIDNPDKLHINSISTTADGKVYLVGESGIGFVSNDQGDSWTTMNMPYAGSIFGIETQENSDNLIAYGLQGNLMASTDAGKTWSHKKMKSGASFLGGMLNSEGLAYVVGHGGLVVDFKVNDIENVNIRSHPSGAAFSTILIKDDTLILAGQFGIVSWQLK